MSRKVAVSWHAVESLIAGGLYFFFVLPRTKELVGEWPHALGMVMRIVCGALIGLAALPVVFTLLRTRKPELGTPQLALSLRTWSIAAHVLAGVLIVGTAISEIWLSLDKAGQWLFGIYGAAAAIAVLGICAFYLAFLAELPPPPPKPLKKKAEKRRRGRRGKADEDADEEEAPEATDTADTAEEIEAADNGEDSEAGSDQTDGTEPAEDDKPAEVTPARDDAADAAEDDSAENDEVEPENDTDHDVNGAETRNGGLRNRRGSAKITMRRRKRSRGGVALDARED